MNRKEQIERVRQIAENGDCESISCRDCPLGNYDEEVCGFNGSNVQARLLAKGWLAENEQKENNWHPASVKPSPGQKVIATYRNNLGNRRTIMAWWIPVHWMECSCEYDEELDCSYLPDGWYEVVENWDDWGFIQVTDGYITHWMPLPEVPK